MLRAPRWGDPEWWRQSWIEGRPRLLAMDVRVQRFRLRWAMPAWALEESLRGAALLALWGGYALARFAPRQRQHAALRRWLPGAPWGALLVLLEGVGEGVLALPHREPLLQVSVGRDVDIRVVSI